MTNQQQWLAPEYYNMTSEMERHEADKTALKWLSETGEYEEITYGELLKRLTDWLEDSQVWDLTKVTEFWS